MGEKRDVTVRHYTTRAQPKAASDAGRGRRSPLPQLVLDVALVEDVPLGVLHQEHDCGSAGTTVCQTTFHSDAKSI